MIVGSGVDLIEFARVEREMSRHGPGLLDEVLTPLERAAADASPSPIHAYAAAFVAKEASFKALGTGKTGRMSWHDVTMTRDPGGPPRLVFAGEAARVAADAHVTTTHLALACTRTLALAWVVLARP